MTEKKNDAPSWVDVYEYPGHTTYVKGWGVEFDREYLLELYEENGDFVYAIVYNGAGEPLKVLDNITDIPAEDFIAEARAFFPGREYDPDAFYGSEMEDVAHEIEVDGHLIASITQDEVTTNPQYMGPEGMALFGIK